MYNSVKSLTCWPLIFSFPNRLQNRIQDVRMAEELLRPGPTRSNQSIGKIKKKIQEVREVARENLDKFGSKLNEFRSGYVDSKQTYIATFRLNLINFNYQI